jgi:hypothetical protein
MTAPAATTGNHVDQDLMTPWQVAYPRAHEPAGQCPRCGAAGTHYLTCPSLRLPPGYRLTEDLQPEYAGCRGEHHGIHQASRVFGRSREGQPGGPDHPDWPRRPRYLSVHGPLAGGRGRLAFHVFAALAEFIREPIIEGARDGLDAARCHIWLY